jgi:hypothetical protein
MKAIERLYLYIDYKKYKPTNFEKEIGLSSGYLSIQKKRNADIGESIINKINDYCQDLNIEWLLTGNGQMLKESRPVKEEKEEGTVPIQQVFELLKAQLEEKDKQIMTLAEALKEAKNDINAPARAVKQRRVAR